MNQDRGKPIVHYVEPCPRADLVGFASIRERRIRRCRRTQTHAQCRHTNQTCGQDRRDRRDGRSPRLGRASRIHLWQTQSACPNNASQQCRSRPIELVNSATIYACARLSKPIGYPTEAGNPRLPPMRTTRTADSPVAGTCGFETETGSGRWGCAQRPPVARPSANSRLRKFTFSNLIRKKLPFVARYANR